jgi:myo-inositol-1(or 4)-monophosphatase
MIALHGPVLIRKVVAKIPYAYNLNNLFGLSVFVSIRDHLTVARKTAAEAASLLRRDYLRDAQITDDHGKDIKTHADVAAQDLILSRLEATCIPVLAEESDSKEVNLDSTLWLVDPLDGTLNFSRGFEMAAVSIALWDNGEPVLGVVHHIHHDRCYFGVVGESAWCDDRPLRVSDTADIQHAILATGFPSGRSYGTDSLLSFVHSVKSFKKVRMLGSAALMLAQVAAGHFDVYEEEDIYLWDVAAGLALVISAGGQFSMTPGSGAFQYHVRSHNGFF